MSVSPTGIATTANKDIYPHPPHGMARLALGAIGVVFGDIGTSPLYAFRETFANPHHPLPLDNAHILGVISLIFWSMMIVVSVKYVAIIMRADNKGEGGSLALLALVSGQTKTRRWSRGIVLLGVFATALFYASPVLYPIEIVPERFHDLVMANPLTPIFIELRHLVIDNSAPTALDAAGSWLALLPAFLITVVLCVVAVKVFSREAPRIAEEL